MTGTPRTLREAIANATTHGGVEGELAERRIERHVRDLLAQKFGVVMLRADCPAYVSQLFESITADRPQDWFLRTRAK